MNNLYFGGERVIFQKDDEVMNLAKNLKKESVSGLDSLKNLYSDLNIKKGSKTGKPKNRLMNDLFLDSKVKKGKKIIASKMKVSPGTKKKNLIMDLLETKLSPLRTSKQNKKSRSN